MSKAQFYIANLKDAKHVVQPRAGAALYTLFIVTKDAECHYPVLMANNGKVAFNEPVKRANKLERSFGRFKMAVTRSEVAVERITEADFRKKFPQFAANKGGRKKSTNTKK